MKKKLIKLSHDTKATFWTKAGHYLKHVSEHPKILGKILIQENSLTNYTNEFEKSYYGYCDPFDFLHPETQIHVLKDVRMAGYEGHIFFDHDHLF